MTNMPELENLDDMSFSELMKRSVSEIPRLCSEWTDFNAHDPGMTFLEMLMWLTEMQRYHLSRITEDHLESYLRLVGTRAEKARPAVVLARVFPEETILVKKETFFYIGDIPYRPLRDTIITDEKPEIIFRENGAFITGGLDPFKGGVLPLYHSHNETVSNPMREGFYPRAEIRARLIARNGEVECRVSDGTYGFYQSGFVNISLPDGFDGDGAALRLDIISDGDLETLSADRVGVNILELFQLGESGDTMGAEGRVKENVRFSADIGGKKLAAAVYGEIRPGKNAEAPRDAFARFNSEQRRLPRAVTKEDYERLALETPGLRAELVNVFSKEAGKVSVCVKTCGGRLRENEIKNLKKILFEAKPVGTEIEILTPVIFSARLVISAVTDGWAGGRKLTEHIRSVFEPLEKRMGALISMPGLFESIGSSPAVSEIKGMLLRLGKGIELSEGDTMKLPEDGLLKLDEIIIQ